MPYHLNPAPWRALDADGYPLAGAKAYFYLSGTSTPVTVYSNSAATIPHPESPDALQADGNGIFPPVFSSDGAAVKVNVTTAADVQVPGYPIDPVQLIDGSVVGASSVSVTPFTGVGATDVQAALEELQDNIDALDVATVIYALKFQQNGTDVVTTATIPIDGTTPQVSEGAEVLTLGHTPTNADHRLRIGFHVTVSAATTDFVSLAVFTSDSTSAIHATGHYVLAGHTVVISGFCYYALSDTTTKTITVRIGGAGASLTSPGTVLGTPQRNTLEVMEVL